MPYRIPIIIKKNKTKGSLLTVLVYLTAYLQLLGPGAPSTEILPPPFPPSVALPNLSVTESWSCYVDLFLWGHGAVKIWNTLKSHAVLLPPQCDVR